MSVEARIKSALDGFGDPVEKSMLDAAARWAPARYYTFSCRTSGAAFGDNAPSCERVLVSVHLFAPLNMNCIQRVKETKRALSAAGCTWPEVVDATDQDGQHYVFECETVDDIGDTEAT